MSDWIYCADQMPAMIEHVDETGIGSWEESEPALVYAIRNDDDQPLYGIGIYVIEDDDPYELFDHPKEYWHGTGYDETDLYSCSVIAWQPLPKPPEV